MTSLPDSVLVESISARSQQMASLDDDRATEVLNKAKAIVFAMWQGTGTATTEQIADYYEVSVDTVQKVIQRHREELEPDGLVTLKGKSLKALRSQGLDGVSIPVSTTILTVWSPRAAVRLGMLLTSSETAKKLRTCILDALMVIPAQFERVRILGLENENLKLQLAVAQAQKGASDAQRQLCEFNSAVATLHGAPMLALIQGRPEAVVKDEVEVEKVILCNQSGVPIAISEGISKSALARRFKLKKSADVVSWLRSVGKDGLLIQGFTAVPCEYVPRSCLAELDRLWAAKKGYRQRLLGE